MKKYVVKTTKEFSYDEKGFITKEVVTEESYEQEVHTGGTVGGGGRITSGTISSKDISAESINADKIYTKVTGDNPLTAKLDANTGITVVTNKTVGDIIDEVKNALDRELKLSQNKFLKF